MRVHITYPTGAHGERELPFVVGVLGNFSGRPVVAPVRRLSQLEFIPVDPANFDQLFKALLPHLTLDVANKLATTPLSLCLSLRFSCLDDFKPASVLLQLKPSLAALGLDPEGLESVPAGPVADQIEEIAQQPDFLALEASWRGLHRLVTEGPLDPLWQVHVLDVSKQELLRDHQRSPEIHNCALWKKIEAPLSAGLASSQRAPFHLLLGDYEFTKDANDIELLQHMASIAASWHAPFIAAGAASQFLRKDAADEPTPGSPENRWKHFRKSGDSLFVGLCVPWVLLPPDGGAHGSPVWDNRVYLVGLRLKELFYQYRWCAALIGDCGVSDSDRGQLFASGLMGIAPDGTILSSASTQVPFRYRSLAEMMMAAHETTPGVLPAIEEGSSLSTVFAVTRFIHYLQTIIADYQLTGRTLEVSHEELRQYLEHWLSRYTIESQGPSGLDLSEFDQVRYPLQRSYVVNVSSSRASGEGVQLILKIYPRLHVTALSQFGAKQQFYLTAQTRAI